MYAGIRLLCGKGWTRKSAKEKVTRGIKCVDSPILNGYQQYHNYFRELIGLDGKTPAEAAGIKIEGQNKIMTVIQNAAKAN